MLKKVLKSFYSLKKIFKLKKEENRTHISYQIEIGILEDCLSTFYILNCL